MITVRCNSCRRKIFKYRKFGKGKLLHCWRERIVADYSLREGDLVKCECGAIIGVDEQKWINLKQGAIEYSGTVVKRSMKPKNM